MLIAMANMSVKDLQGNRTNISYLYILIFIYKPTQPDTYNSPSQQLYNL